ncbi:hypothetical protein ACGFNU_05770 [Spirillospora sp. NPDC048911]|uniref:hypothetical protein n=1 Tax=Spirillospora sp. NPDC048911 TaxID=3364527 RepID=UPI0037222F04
MAAPTLGGSVVGGLVRLGEALRALDDTEPDTDSIAFDHATDQLIHAARTVVRSAEPVLARPSATAAAVRDALTRATPAVPVIACDGAGGCVTCRYLDPAPCSPNP